MDTKIKNVEQKLREAGKNYPNATILQAEFATLKDKGDAVGMNSFIEKYKLQGRKMTPQMWTEILKPITDARTSWIGKAFDDTTWEEAYYAMHDHYQKHKARTATEKADLEKQIKDKDDKLAEAADKTNEAVWGWAKTSGRLEEKSENEDWKYKRPWSTSNNKTWGRGSWNRCWEGGDEGKASGSSGRPDKAAKKE